MINMFEFLKHKNVIGEEDKETLTANSSEIASNSSLETENDDGLELFYESEGYKEVKTAYDIVGQEDFLSEVKKQLIEGADDEDIQEISIETDAGVENGTLVVEVQPEDLITSMPADQEVEQANVVEPAPGEENHFVPQGLVRIGGVLVSATAALTLAFASCDGPDTRPRYKPEADEKENVVGPVAVEQGDQKVLPKTETAPVTATQPTQTQIVKPVSPTVVEKVPGKNVESTLPTRRGVAEVYEKFAPEMLPSGDPIYGYLTLNDAMAEAAALGGLKPVPELGVYSLEGAKNPSKQGIPFKSTWILKLSEGKLPTPLMKDASFTKYISKTPKSGVFHITDENLAKYKADLEKNIRASAVDRAGKFSKVEYKRKMEETAGLAADQLNTVILWLNTKEAERANLVDKWVKPYQNRTGTIKDKK